MATNPFGEVWLTIEEIVALGKSKRRVLMNVSNGKWKSKPAPLSGLRGRPSNVVALDSLPEELQRRWLAAQTQQPPEPEYSSDSIDENPSIAPDKPTEQLRAEQRLTAALQQYPIDVRPAVIEEAQRRMDITRRYLALPNKRQKVCGCELRVTVEAGASPAGRGPCVRTAPVGSAARNGDSLPVTSKLQIADSKATYEFTPAVIALCQEAACTNETIINYYKSRQHVVRKGIEPRCTRAISPVTLDNWSRRLRKEGVIAFLPAPATAASRPCGPNDKRRVKISPAADEWIKKNWRSKPTARALHQALKKLAHRHGWKIPSEATIYRAYKNRPEIVKVAQRSQKEYVGKFAPYVPRDYRDLEALQILCGDHSKRDVMVRLADGTLVRPWLTLWQCVRTLLIWGWYLDLTPSSRTIGLAYANGVRTFGAQPIARPDEDFYSYLYTDQGKDYKSHHIGGKDLSFRIDGGLEFLLMDRRIGMVDDLGLKQILARGYNAREKMVERTHRDISTWEESTFDGMYCGRDAKNKPDAHEDAVARHKRLLKKAEGRKNSPLLEDSPFMAIDEYLDALGGWITEFNNSVHQRVTLGGAQIVPMEEYERLYTTRYEISEEALALLVMKAERRRVGKNGIWLHQRNWSYLHPDLAYYKGQDVEVRYDEDFSRCFVVTPKGILEASLVTASTLRNPNKETLATIKRQTAHERNIIREHSLLTQSMIRGETTEDRVAQMIEPEEERVPLAVAAAGGNGVAFWGQGHAAPATGSHSSSAREPGEHVGVGHRASVHQFTRLGGRRISSVPATRPVTVDQVAEVEIDESIFEDEEPQSNGGNLVKMWEDEEDG